MQTPGCETLAEVDEVLRCVRAALDSGHSFGCVVVTSTLELAQLQELQFYVGSSAEGATELERQLHVGRIVLAVCPCIRQAAVKYNILETEARKNSDDSLRMTQDHCIRYASGVMVNCLEQRREVNPCLND